MIRDLEEQIDKFSFAGIKGSSIKCPVSGIDTFNLLFTLPDKRKILSTRDGFIDAKTVGENICPQSLWQYAHQKAKDFRKEVRKSLPNDGIDCAMLYTGADPRQWACGQDGDSAAVFLTVDTRTNAMRAGTDEPSGKRSSFSPGTINIFVFTDKALSDGAMSRCVITTTEAKCAALQDRGIKSSYSPEKTATGTGTDNIIIVPGNKDEVDILRGHSPLSLAIGKAVMAAMITAIDNGTDENE